jgi:hypothetical protein
MGLHGLLCVSLKYLSLGNHTFPYPKWNDEVKLIITERYLDRRREDEASGLNE